VRVIGNILWLLLGGLALALAYVGAGLLCFVLIVTIPFGVQAFKLAGFTLWPFGSALVRIPGVVPSAVGNVLWFILFGWWLALSHVIAGIICAITIIGIPFAVAHFKLAGAALFPFGRTVVSIQEARMMENAQIVQPLGSAYR
jgi:uncharacterized membrane protein YccF (DUF307 family)